MSDFQINEGLQILLSFIINYAVRNIRKVKNVLITNILKHKVISSNSLFYATNPKIFSLQSQKSKKNITSDELELAGV